MNDTAHSISEFKDFPWNRLSKGIKYREFLDRGEPTEWQVSGVSRGGITAGVDFNPNKPHIDFIREDASADAWEIPEGLIDLVDEYFSRGVDGAERKFKRGVQSFLKLLGVGSSYETN